MLPVTQSAHSCWHALSPASAVGKPARTSLGHYAHKAARVNPQKQASTGNRLRLRPHLRVWTTHLACPQSSKRQSRAHCEENESAVVGPAPPFMHAFDNVAPMADPGSVVHTPLIVTQTILQALQAVSTQPDLVLTLGLPAEA